MPGPAAGLTSVVVVAADSGPLLERCVRSVLAEADSELILVDNASTDGVVEQVSARHAGDARLRVVRNPANRGFGAACNQGAGLARGDALLFLNPDCELPAGAIAGLRNHLSDTPQAGIIGVQLLDADGTPGRGSRRHEPTLRRSLMQMSGLSRFAGRWPVLAGVEMSPRVGGPALEMVDAVSGACMLLPRTAFETLGGFDEGYFLHAEDLDLCRRARDRGMAVACAHDVAVTHHQGSSSHHRAVFVAGHKRRGLWRYFRRFDPAARNPFLRGLVWSGLWMRFLVTALRAGRRRTP